MQFLKRKLATFFATMAAVIGISLISTSAMAWTMQDYYDTQNEIDMAISYMDNAYSDYSASYQEYSGLYSAWQANRGSCSGDAIQVSECQQGHDDDYYYRKAELESDMYIYLNDYSYWSSVVGTLNTRLDQIKLALGIP